MKLAREFESFDCTMGCREASEPTVRWVERDFAPVNLMNTLDQEFGGRLFQNHASCAQPDGTENQPIVFDGCEHDNAGWELVEIHFFENSEPVFVRHAQVQQEDIGL